MAKAVDELVIGQPSPDSEVAMTASDFLAFSSRTSLCNRFNVLLINTDLDKKASGSSMDLSFFTDSFSTRFRSSFHLYLGVESMVMRGGSLLEAPM